MRAIDDFIEWIERRSAKIVLGGILLIAMLLALTGNWPLDTNDCEGMTPAECSDYRAERTAAREDTH